MTSNSESAPISSQKNFKHQWNLTEDEKLVESLYELYTMRTWKCNTRFKAGYLLQLEKMMLAKLPRCGLKACPLIESCVKTLKRQTMVIIEIFTTGSGFAWNEQDKMVTSEKAVFDLWVKVNAYVLFYSYSLFLNKC